MLSLKHTIEYMSRLPKRFYWAQMAHMQLETVDISFYSSKEPTVSTSNIFCLFQTSSEIILKKDTFQSYG